MDNSFIVNYQGQIELTMGAYNGNYPFVSPFLDGVPYSVKTSQHSMWTLFDYGIPEYFPVIAWSDNESGVYAGAMVSWASSNQRNTLSYHGGGSTKTHPGYAEAQWNWFGKSDAESLYLNEGIEFSMEMYFYQNEGSIDSLFNFCKRTLSQTSIPRKTELYTMASWGGRSSPLPNYYWRFPQASNDYICSQELWRYKSFAIPRSQNGIWDIHFFSIDLRSKEGELFRCMSPVHGTEPLFADLMNGLQGNSSWGEVHWDINGLDSRLRYTVFNNQKKIQVEGTFGSLDTENEVIFLLSSRADGIVQSNGVFSIYDVDPLLDTLAINISDVEGVDTMYFYNDSLKCSLIDTSFSFNVTPSFFTLPKNIVEVEALNIPDDLTYRENFKAINSSSESFIKPDLNYYAYHDLSVNNIDFKIYFQEDSDTIFFSHQNIPSLIYVQNDINTWTIETHSSHNVSFIEFQFKRGTNYHISSEKNRMIMVPKNFQVLCWPNPANEHIKISILSDNKGAIEMTLYDVLGRKIEINNERDLKGINENTFELNIKKLASGILFLIVEQGDKNKMVKMTVIH